MVIFFSIIIMHINGSIDIMKEIFNYSCYEQIIVKISKDLHGIIILMASPYH